MLFQSLWHLLALRSGTFLSDRSVEATSFSHEAQPGEQCDDGNLRSLDGCSGRCQARNPATRGGSRISGKHCDVRTRSLGSLTCQDCFLPAPASFATYFWHAINAERRFTNILLHEPRNALLPKQPSFFMHLCDRRWNPASSAPISLTLPAAVGRGWWFACGGGLE